MTHPYKTREGGATVTVFVPYDCQNNCPFCINKKEYADCSGFSLDKILDSIRVMDSITPRCDFVFTGGEPLANLNALQRMLDTIPAIPEGASAKIKYLTVAPMFAEAIERIYQEISISKLFR